jgi:hypothetical protein
MYSIGEADSGRILAQTNSKSWILEIGFRKGIKTSLGDELGSVRSDPGGPIGGPCGLTATAPCSQLTGRLGHTRGRSKPSWLGQPQSFEPRPNEEIGKHFNYKNFYKRQTNFNSNEV